jgi:hypothetical protein
MGTGYISEELVLRFHYVGLMLTKNYTTILCNNVNMFAPNISRAISHVNVELKTNVSDRDLLGFHRQGRCGEWPHVADIYTSLSNRLLLVCCAVGGRSQTVRSPIRLWPLTVSLYAIKASCLITGYPSTSYFERTNVKIRDHPVSTITSTHYRLNALYCALWMRYLAFSLVIEHSNNT